MSKITDTLKDLTKDMLSEESLQKIEAAFNEAVESKAQEKATVTLEATVAQIDEDHAAKVKQLVEAIDKNHTEKLMKVVNTINESHYEKLKAVVAKYETALNEDAAKLKYDVVKTISDYLDLYLEESFPAEMMAEAVKNKQAASVVSEMRRLLAVDMALANEGIREGVLDGKRIMEEQSREIEALKSQISTLNENVTVTSAKLVLEQKTAGMPKDKKSYMFKILSDKPVTFINENFDYALSMFDKAQKSEKQVLKEEAMKGTVSSNVDVQAVTMKKQEVIQENTSGNADPIMGTYMSELGKY